MNDCAVDIAAEQLILSPCNALYWPRAETLVVADIHFGKAAAFRALGVPVPHGTTAQNLAALDALLVRHPARQIIFLGDFLHARTARTAAVVDAICAWREQRKALTLTLVRGNHDHRAGDPPTCLRMDCVDEPFAMAPFALCHHPQASARGYVLAGHVHPVYGIASATDALRLPCFVVGEDRTVLPSFGAFTGGFAIVPQHGERIFVNAGDTVFEVNTTLRPRRILR